MGCSHRNMRALNCHFPKKIKSISPSLKETKISNEPVRKKSFEYTSTGLKETSNEHFENNFINQL